MVSLPQVHISCYACIILYLYIIILSYELCLWFSVFRVLHHLCTTQCMYDTYMYVHILYMLYDVSLVFYRQSWRHGMATCYRSFASGSGEFGQVFRGFYKDQEVHDHVGACSTRKTWAFGQVCMQVDVHTACSVSVRLTERRCSSNYSSLWIRGCQKQVAVPDLFFTSRTWAKIWPVGSLWYMSVPLLVLSPNCKPSRWITAGYIGIMYGLNHTPPRSFLRKTFKASTCQSMTLRSSSSRHQRWTTNLHWMVVEGCFQQQA